MAEIILKKEELQIGLAMYGAEPAVQLPGIETACDEEAYREAAEQMKARGLVIPGGIGTYGCNEDLDLMMEIIGGR